MEVETTAVLAAVCAVLIAGTAAIAYLGILSFTHIRMRLIVEFYRMVAKRIREEEEVAKEVGESALLQKYRSLHAALEAWLKREGMIRRPAPKGPAPN